MYRDGILFLDEGEIGEIVASKVEMEFAKADKVAVSEDPVIWMEELLRVLRPKKAPEFNLWSSDGRRYTLDNVRGAHGTLIAFISSKCSDVRGLLRRLIEQSKLLQDMGIGTIAIIPGDAKRRQTGLFSHVKSLSDGYKVRFPYVVDEDRRIARAYGASCTLDIFGLNSRDEVQYHGEFEDPLNTDLGGRLFEAFRQIARVGGRLEPPSAARDRSIAE
jgi:peroxiredoxin